jgi:hypothetical protein
MHIVETDDIPYEVVTRSNRRSGCVARKAVREGEISPGVGFTADLILYSNVDGPFSAPRHKHNFDQIRYVISGQPDFGNGQIAADGQISFFPAGASYGPEVIDEAEVLLIQWSDHWMTRAQHDSTYVEMQRTGEFREGYYITVDESGNEHRADGRNAVWETFTQQKMVYPTPRYSQPIVIEPKGFEWRSLGDGVSIKALGRFTEDDVYLASYRWDSGSTLTLTPGRTQLLWISSGEVDVNGATYGPRTAIFAEFGETLAVSGDAGAEAVCFGLPEPNAAQLPATD